MDGQSAGRPGWLEGEIVGELDERRIEMMGPRDVVQSQSVDAKKRSALAGQEIVQSVGRVTQALGGVTAASEGQAGSINEINQAVGQLDNITQQNAALVEEAAAAAQSLKEQAAGLTRMVTSFRLAPGFA